MTSSFLAKTYLAVFGAVFALGACAQIDAKVQMDAPAAAAMANSAGHPERAVCYSGIATIAVPTSGVLSKFEQVEEGRELATGKCAALLGMFAVDAARRFGAP